jgi:hypothetical protein
MPQDRNKIWIKQYAQKSGKMSGIQLQEEFEDTKGVIKILKSKDRQHNRQKGTNNNLRKNTQKGNL